MVLYLGGRHIKLVKCFKYFRTPRRRSGVPLGGGGGSTMIVLGAGWPGITPLVLF